MTPALWKRLEQLALFVAILAVSLFWAAGKTWMSAWAFLGLYVAGIVINAVVLVRHNPELIAERSKWTEGAKPWDKLLALIVGVVGPLATCVVAGLNVRWNSTPPISAEFKFAALLAAAFGFAFTTWAMASNKFFAPGVRIQKERGHAVATGGPYRYLRHPGYAGMLIFQLATPAILGALLAFIPAGVTALVLIVRTALEDRMLQDELEGYKEYAQQVRYRLVPGLW